MDVRERVDPAYRSLVEAAAASAVDPNDWISSPEKVRADRAALLPPPPVPDEIDYTDHDTPGPKGEPAVTVRTYRAGKRALAHESIFLTHFTNASGGTLTRRDARTRDAARPGSADPRVRAEMLQIDRDQ